MKQCSIKDYKPNTQCEIDMLVYKEMSIYMDSNKLTLKRCEKQGWYYFGTQKIFIMLKSGNIIMKVGGGY
jgi:hypothetical protein